MNSKKIIDAINKFKNIHLLVIGDIMLDKYVWGEVNRVSQEAPVQIARINNESFTLGGAANVANNISALGAKATIVGLVGSDEAKNILLTELKKINVNTKGIVIDPSRQTTTKIRVIAQNQQLMRMDYEKTHEPEHWIHETILEFIKSTINTYDAVIISDYSKGVITKELVKEVKAICDRKKKKIIVDPKPKNIALYNDVFIVIPNHIEASRSMGIEERNNNKHIKEIGEKIQKKLNASILIKRGSNGVTLFEKGGNYINIPTKAKEVYDVTGAGDTLVAALALAIASGSDLRTASIISNYAAGIVVGKLGTATVNRKELLSILEKGNNKIKGIEELRQIIGDLKNKGEKIVWTNGCFDLLHVGHTKYLQEAKKLGDVLILGLNTDASIKRIKGKNRPIISENERAEILSALECVDYVTFFDEDTPLKVIKLIMPHTIVKGGDYKVEDVVGKDVVEKDSGKVVIIPLKEGWSTSRLIDNIIRKNIQK